MALAEKIKKCAEEYMSHDDYMKNMGVPVLTVDFVIEQAKRRYPKSYSSEKKEQLLEDEYVNLLGMMVVDCLAHYGAEGEKQHTEKNISRTYQSAYISQDLLDQLPNYVDILY